MLRFSFEDYDKIVGKKTNENYGEICMRKLRMLSLGLAMSLMFSQIAQAAVFITPFGEKIEVSENNTAQQVVPETQIGGQPGAGGPGAVSKEQALVMKPSASYSTKESVQVKANVSSGGSGAQQNANGIQSGEGQTENKQNTVQTVIDETKAAAVTKPTVAAQSAILYDVTHDKVLFEKNADTKYYPASITKVLTALLVLEHAKLDETVTFSKTAVTNLESGAVTLSMQEGDKVSVKDCLYGLMLKSANEVANGLAEHVGGSISNFCDMMDAKAKELGCTNSNFENPNGLNNTNHLTTARDMAKIAAAAFENPEFCKIVSTTSYKFPATKAAGARTISMGHKMLYPNDSRYYEGILGGKTGYTSKAGNTLVTCVERDGVRFVAVVLKSQSTHYTDTKAMLDYGYALNNAGAIVTKTAETQNVNHSGGPGAANAGNGGPGVQQNTATAAGTTTTAYHKWIADGSLWRFELADGTRLSNCLVTIDGKDYAFDTEGKMVTGWLTLGPNWHYFGNSGAMIKSDWRQDGGLWFYLGADGAMMKNIWIDNQYYVGADGVWVE